METQLSDRLQQLRKENGYSQEQLADELNVSRQAISKWECGAALPDTENLIALSRIYNCSVDEILFHRGEGAEDVSTDNPTDPAKNDQAAEPEPVEVAPQEAEPSQCCKSKRTSAVLGVVSAATVMLSVIAYILLGTFLDKWHPAWIVFFAIPVVGGLAESIVSRNAHHFPFPVLVTAVYLLMGCQWGLWHPWWVLFLLIPVYYTVADIVRKK